VTQETDIDTEKASLPACVIFGVLILVSLAGSGCSTHRLAVNAVADALAGGGASYARDDDPELVAAATPFSLKLIESLLDETPRHPGLLLAAAGGFTQYAYAFVQQEADEMESRDLAAAEALRARARRLHLRAQGYGLRGLEAKHPGFGRSLTADPAGAVKAMTREDVPFLYWTATSWAAAISLSKDQPDLVAKLPAVEAMIDRALELDDAFERGAIHTFLIAYEMSRPGAPGDPAERARARFDRAVALSGGQDAAPFVALAEAVSVQRQDVKEFESLLGRAMAMDADGHPDTRLANLVMQRRARWLLSRKADLFLVEGD
jgi:predicted anti-sigma-YlaC factor YlaD